ncbi:hypothetical protein D3C80_1760570 [compost metagenome]
MGGGAIDAQVDGARVIAGGRLKLRRRMPRLCNLRSASWPAFHQSFLLQHGHGFGHRGDVHPQCAGEIAMGWQAFARLELAVADRFGQRLGQLGIKGFCLVALQRRAGFEFVQQLFELTHGALSLLVML